MNVPFLKRQDADLAVPVLVASLIVGSGIVFSSRQLQSSRPQGASSPGASIRSGQVVAARLWEDPFAAASKELAQATDSTAQKRTDGPAESPAELQEKALKNLAKGAENGQHCLVLPVFVPGSSYLESSEQRLRMRTAVLSALSVSGYVPWDAEHLGVLPFDLSRQAGREVGDKWVCAAPFEWLCAADGAKPVLPYDRVLVMWVSDLDVPGDCMIAATEQLVTRLQSGLKCSFDISVIGPFDSDDLVKLESTAASTTTLPAAFAEHHISFTTATATISDRDIRQVLRQPPSPHRSRQLFAPLTFDRTATTDDVLAGLLVHELRLRGVRPATQSASSTAPDGGRIVLVSEWDTSYARRLTSAFDASLYGSDERGTTNAHVDRYFYFRGVDGAATNRQPAAKAPTSSTPDLASLLSKLQGNVEVGEERPESGAQLDYLRRLATRMRDDELQRGPVRAIGIFGSDVYDKLLVLQALRPQFPGAIFFTTDLDARLTHSSQRAWTRNLVIASGLDLRLGSALQREAATFRDSYQTATFLATLRALGDQQAQEQWRSIPHTGRVFEIGLAGHVDLEPVSEDQHLIPVRARPRLFPVLRNNTSAVIAVVVLFGGVAFLVASMSPSTSKRTAKGFKGFAARGLSCFLRLLFVAACVVLLLLRFDDLADEPGQEPFAWFEGVSVWPTIFFRFVAGSLALYYLISQVRQWKENATAIHADLISGPGPALPSLTSNIQAVIPKKSLWTRFRGRLNLCWTWCRGRPSWIYSQLLEGCRFLRRCWRRLRRWSWLEPQFGMLLPSIASWWEVPTPHAHQLWHHYVRLGTWPRRLVRAFILTVFYAVLGICLFTACPRDNPPIRGTAAAHWNTASLLFAPVLINLLVMLVLDSIRLCGQMIRQLSANTITYSAGAISRVTRQTGFTGNIAENWLTISIIGERTACIGRAVYYPLVALLIMVAARNVHFDAWRWSLPLMLVMSTSLVIMLAAAWMLDRSAAAARASILRSLRSQVDVLKRLPPRPTTVARLAMFNDAIVAIDGYREGAFSPLRSNPLVSAVLIPVGGMLLVAAVDAVSTRL